MEKRYQVIIVGGGPVGVALAVDLGLRGVSCVLVERHLTPQQIPKGQNLTQRSLEHFYFWGIVDELRAARVAPSGYPIGAITAYGDLMSEYWFAPVGREAVKPYYFQANERLPQYLTEKVLRKRMADFPHVESLFGWSAKTIEQDERGVRVTISEEDGPGTRVLEAEYLVGCDGGRSSVRAQTGIDRSGTDFGQRMLLTVFRSRDLHEGLKRFPEKTTYRVLHPDLNGVWQFFGRIDVGEGWFFHAPVPRDATADNYDFNGLIQRAAGFPLSTTFDYIGFWELRVAFADTYRQGRAFIAGDAAHIHPPYGAYGLNTGLDDVANLGWKLAAALEGWGGERLLESYSEERRPVFMGVLLLPRRPSGLDPQGHRRRRHRGQQLRLRFLRQLRVDPRRRAQPLHIHRPGTGSRIRPLLLPGPLLRPGDRPLPPRGPAGCRVRGLQPLPLCRQQSGEPSGPIGS